MATFLVDGPLQGPRGLIMANEKLRCIDRMSNRYIIICMASENATSFS